MTWVAFESGKRVPTVTRSILLHHFFFALNSGKANISYNDGKISDMCHYGRGRKSVNFIIIQVLMGVNISLMQLTIFQIFFLCHGSFEEPLFFNEQQRKLEQ